MIPEFNKDGNLPEGIYRASEKEFLNHFCVNTARRKWLGDRLRELFSTLREIGSFEKLFIWGSFVSNKEYPNDVDVLVIMSESFELENIPDDLKTIFNYVEARVRFNMDIFWSKYSIGEEMINLWLDTYQMTKDFKRRGIVEVLL